jgi:Holliday junction DNA helicase RuvA
MFYYILGKIVDKGENFFILETDLGIAFKIFSNKGTISKIKENEKLKFYVYSHFKEEGIDFYGFLNEGELRFFEMLTSVSGVGPKTALAILDLDSFSNLMAAIFSRNIDVLLYAPGVGRKTAERIVLELQNKIKPEEISGLEGLAKVNIELMEILVGLGYDKTKVKKALEKMPREAASEKLEEKIKKVLKILSNDLEKD